MTCGRTIIDTGCDEVVCDDPRRRAMSHYCEWLFTNKPAPEFTEHPDGSYTVRAKGERDVRYVKGETK